MIKRQWIKVEDIRDLSALDKALYAFFDEQNPSQIVRTAHAAKKTSAGEQASPAQLAWLYRVRQIAKELLAPKYQEAAARAAIPKLKALLSAPKKLDMRRGFCRNVVFGWSSWRHSSPPKSMAFVFG